VALMGGFVNMAGVRSRAFIDGVVTSDRFVSLRCSIFSRHSAQANWLLTQCIDAARFDIVR
jgi:hypothetical protein